MSGMEQVPLIFDIKRCSFEDGPGVRTAVFLKGCNLNCFWCHNPEGKKAEAEYAFFGEKCIGCGSCKSVCPAAEHCIDCGACVESCPTQARKRYGKAYAPEELFHVICADTDYYRATGGGVTFSGGECMLYPQFLVDVAAQCKVAGISVAVDTAGNVPWSHFLRVLPFADLFLYDIKCLDPKLHKQGTGCDNIRILQNLERLLQTGKQIIIRAPRIPGFNDGAEIERVEAYCRERMLPCEVLAYHRFGEDKLLALRSAGCAK